MSRTENRSFSDNPLDDQDPIGLVEEYTLDQNWQADRSQEHELWVELPGQWGNHRLWVAYHEDSGFLQFNCYLNLKIPERLTPPVSEVMALVNERIWLGHFEIWTEEMVPVYRIVVPMRGSELSDAQVEDVMVALYQETERFYPAFQWVIWGGKTPREAVSAAIVDTEGEA